MNWILFGAAPAIASKRSSASIYNSRFDIIKSGRRAALTLAMAFAHAVTSSSQRIGDYRRCVEHAVLGDALRPARPCRPRFKQKHP